jgi:hypothetical protein
VHASDSKVMQKVTARRCPLAEAPLILRLMSIMGGSSRGSGASVYIASKTGRPSCATTFSLYTFNSELVDEDELSSLTSAEHLLVILRRK